jgi:uncharacterized protein YqjF (DUF2071 family)
VTAPRIAAEPVSMNAPALTGVRIMTQDWRDLTFLHWRVDPVAVQPLLPAGTRPDEHDGSSWVGLIPFRMVDAGVGTGPAFPWLGTFAETNVRLYSVDGQGRRGVVFRTLEASRLAVVLGARAAFALPYSWARMRVTESAGVLTYASQRRWPGPRSATTYLRVRPGGPLASADPLADFLTARWGLHTRAFGRLLFVPNHHEPWPLQRAEVLDLDDRLLAAAGLPGVTRRPPDSVLFSRGVHTEFGWPRAVGS